MSKRPLKTVQDVREALDAAAQAHPERVGLRTAQGRKAGFYAYHGKPCCLVGDILLRLGFSMGLIKALDNQEEGGPVLFRNSGLHRRFEPLAFEMMCCIQKINDRGHTWARVREDVLTIDSYWGRHGREARYVGREWLRETRALNADEHEG